MAGIQLTDQNFEQEVLKSKEPVLVDFWAEWCGPCRVMNPIVDELEREYKEKPVKIGKMNVDENQETAGKYKVMSIPTFILFKNGEVINQAIGAQSKDQMKKIIDQNL